MNAGMMLSMGVFFSIMIAGLAQKLPKAMFTGLMQHGIPAKWAHYVASLPPTASLFAALLGYNPLKNLLPKQVLTGLPAQQQHYVVGKVFFPHLIGGAFMHGLSLTFTMSIVMSLIAALASALRGKHFIHRDEEPETSDEDKLSFDVDASGGVKQSELSSSSNKKRDGHLASEP